MDEQKLATAIRGKIALLNEWQFEDKAIDEDDLRDVSFLLKTLAHIVDGVPVVKAFGSPGDWGYETPIGAALAGR